MIDPLHPAWDTFVKLLPLFGDKARGIIGDEIYELVYQINQKEFKLKNLRRLVDENFSTRINELRREKFYPAFNYSSPANLLTNIKADMRDELEAEIKRDRDELAAIDDMIDKINEIELQVKRDS